MRVRLRVLGCGVWVPWAPRIEVVSLLVVAVLTSRCRIHALPAPGSFDCPALWVHSFDQEKDIKKASEISETERKDLVKQMARYLLMKGERALLHKMVFFRPRGVV